MIAAIKEGKFAFKTLEQTRQERAWLQWYCAVNDYLLNPSNLWKLCYNYSALRLMYGPYELERTEPAVDLGSILETLCRVHGNEIFEHGAFTLHGAMYTFYFQTHYFMIVLQVFSMVTLIPEISCF